MKRNSTRRSFLQLCGGSAILASWLDAAIGRAQGQVAPKRLVIIHRPNGSIAEDWLNNGQRGPILEPFAGVWNHTLALKGVNVRPSNGLTSGSHEAGLLTVMTGANLGATDRTNDDFRSTAESLEQTLLKRSPELSKPSIKSLQLGAHGNQDGGNETPNVTMSYSGPNTPLYPDLSPNDVYARLFADLMPSGAAELLARRARRKSVLDYLTADLTRVRAQFPASFKDDLDIHESAIRELEQALDGSGMQGPACTKPAAIQDVSAGGDYKNLELVGDLQLKLITAALACDLTRVVTFQWATGASLVKFGDFGANNYHSTSHDNNRPVLSRCERWFSEKTAPFIQSLIDHDDVGGGKVIDSTLVWYINEVSEGWTHDFNDYPFLLFGGDAVGLTNRGRVLDVSGAGHTSNDVWTSLAPVFGAELGQFPTESKGAIPGLFG